MSRREREAAAIVAGVEQRLAGLRAPRIHRGRSSYVPAVDGIDARAVALRASQSHWHAVSQVSVLELRALAVWALWLDSELSKRLQTSNQTQGETQ